MGKDYISMMTDEELLYICHEISIGHFRAYYQKYPKVFHRIAKGRSLPKMSDDEVFSSTLRGKKDISVSNLINSQVTDWLNEISEERTKQEQSGESVESALIKTMPYSHFAHNLPLYFALSEEERSEEYIRLLSCAVELVSKERDANSHNEGPSLSPDEFAQFAELDEQVERLQRQNEKQAQDYEIKIASLEQKVSVANDVVQKVSEQKAAFEKELQHYRELSRYKVIAEEQKPLPGYSYISICRAYSNDRGNWLYRYADVNNGTIEIISKDEYYKSLYRRNGIVADGSWNVWSWKVSPREDDPSRDKIESAIDTRINPIEVIVLEECHTLTDVVNTIKNGGVINHVFDKVLLGHYNGTIFEGIFCVMSELTFDDSRYSIPSSVRTLPVFEIMKDDIVELPEDVYLVHYFSLGMPTRTVPVWSPMEIVKELLLSRIKRADMMNNGFSRTEFQRARSYFEKIPVQDLRDEIAASCDCSTDEADSLLRRFFTDSEAIINGTALENDVMVRLIRNNAELYAQYMESLRAEWNEQYQAKLTEADAALDAVRKETVIEEAKANKLKSVQKTLEQTIEQNKAEIAAQEQLAEDVKTKVLEKIESARKDAASFIAENAFLQPMQQQDKAMPVSVSTMQRYFSGEEASTDDKEVSTNWEELIETLSYGLEEAGVSHSVSLGLSALMYSACLKRVPLLLAGPNGRDIADAFSLGLFGKRPGKLVCNGEFDSTAIERLLNSDDTVIVIEQPFDAAWYAHILTLFAQQKKFLIALNPFVEDLLVEPTGLWNYCVPVITEMIVTKPSTGQYISGSITDTFEVFKSSLDVKRFKAASFMNLRPMVNYNIQAIGSDMVEMCDGQNSGCEFPLLVYPLAYLTGKLDMFNERIQSGQVTLSSEIKTLMSPFLGDEE